MTEPQQNGEPFRIRAVRAAIRSNASAKSGFHKQTTRGHSEEFQNAGVIIGAGMTSQSFRAEVRSGKEVVRNVVEEPH